MNNNILSLNDTFCFPKCYKKMTLEYTQKFHFQYKRCVQFYHMPDGNVIFFCSCMQPNMRRYGRVRSLYMGHII